MQTIKMISSCFLALGIAALASGCSSSRDIEVSGSVSSGEALQHDVSLTFYDVDNDGEEVHSTTLSAAGPYKETVAIAGNKLRIVALEDANNDGECSSGERWGETTVDVPEEDEKVEQADVALSNAACP